MTAQPPMGSPQPPAPYGQPHQHYQPPQQPPPKKGLSTGCIIGIVLAVVSVPVLGVVAALGIYGMRRYIAASKTAEAKNTIGAISRGAAASYERLNLEGGEPKLCESEGPLAVGHGPVPSKVPAGKKYQPSSRAGEDYDAGSAEGGWRCLRFAMTQPHYYQYHYNKGGNYQTSSNFLPSGEEAYEAAALGDLDGDGTYSEFSTTGKVEAGQLKRETKVYISNEFE